MDAPQQETAPLGEMRSAAAAAYMPSSVVSVDGRLGLLPPPETGMPAMLSPPPPFLCALPGPPSDTFTAGTPVVGVAPLMTPIAGPVLSFPSPVLGRLESVASASITPEDLAASARDLAKQRRRQKKLQKQAIVSDTQSTAASSSGDGTAALTQTQEESGSQLSPIPTSGGTTRKRTRTKRGGPGTTSSRKQRKASKEDATPTGCEMMSTEQTTTSASNSTVVSPRPTTKKKKSRNKIPDEPSERTLWDLVVLNKRAVTPEDLAARRAAKAEAAAKMTAGGATAAAPPVADSEFSLDQLLDRPAPIDDPPASMALFDGPSSQGASGTTVDLFGSSDDPLLSHNDASLRIDAEGNLLLEESRTTGPTADDRLFSLLEGRTVVDEDFATGQTVQPYAKAYKYTRATQWTEQDEECFFSALETFGLDFVMVHAMLPQFTTKQLRDKYKCEQRRCASRIEAALDRRRKIDVRQYEELYGPIDVTTHFRPEDQEDEEEELGTSKRRLESRPPPAPLLPGPSSDGALGHLFADDVPNASGGNSARRSSPYPSPRSPLESGVVSSALLDEDIPLHAMFESSTGPGTSDGAGEDSLAALLGL